MKLVIVALLTVVVGGCQPSAPPPVISDAEGTSVAAEGGMLTTERESYSVAEPVRLILHNQSADPLGANLCMSELERREGEQWVAVPAPSDEVCTAELPAVFPGGQLSHEFRLRQDLTAGEYRFRTRVENMTTNTAAYHTSNVFTLRR